MNLNLEDLEPEINRMVELGRYTSKSEYIRQLIREDYAKPGKLKSYLYKAKDVVLTDSCYYGLIIHQVKVFEKKAYIMNCEGKRFVILESSIQGRAKDFDKGSHPLNKNDEESLNPDNYVSACNNPIVWETSGMQVDS